MDMINQKNVVGGADNAKLNTKSNKKKMAVVYKTSVFFQWFTDLLLLVGSFLLDTDRDMAFYQVSGLVWMVIRTMILVDIGLQFSYLRREKMSFIYKCVFYLGSMTLILLGGNGGFGPNAFQWVIEGTLLVALILTVCCHRMFNRVYRGIYSVGTIFGAIFVIILQWYNCAFSMLYVYKASGVDTKVGACFMECVKIMLPGGRTNYTDFIVSLPMIKGYFMDVMFYYLWFSLVAVIVITFYKWAVNEHGESMFINGIGYIFVVMGERAARRKEKAEEAKVEEIEARLEERAGAEEPGEEATEESATEETEELVEEAEETVEELDEETEETVDESAVEEIEETIEESVEEPFQEVIEETAEESVEEPVEEETENTAEESAMEEIEETAEELAMEETEETAEETAEEETEETVEETAEEVAEETVEETAEEVTEETAEESAEEVAEELVEETEETVEEPAVEVAEETVEETATEVVEETVEESVEEETEETSEESATEETEEAVKEPVGEPVEEETAEEPVEEPVEEPSEEVIEETAEEPIEEPVIFRDNATLSQTYGDALLLNMLANKSMKTFKADGVDGFISYKTVGKEAIVLNGPLSETSDYESLYQSFENYVAGKKLNLVIVNASEAMKADLKPYKLRYVKCGAVPKFSLDSYKLRDTELTKKQRKQVWNKYKVMLAEYRYYDERDDEVETAFKELNDKWLESRTPENLTVYKRRQRDLIIADALDFKHPETYRYYYAGDETGNLTAFMVFAKNGDGSCSFIAGRKSENASKNTMELLVHEAFASLKSEGANSADMGLFPIAKDAKANQRGRRWLELIYRYNSDMYNAKDYDSAYGKLKTDEWKNVYILTKEYNQMNK